MTNLEKHELRQLCRGDFTFKQIRDEVSCSDATIKRYMKVFSPTVRAAIKKARKGMV